MKRGLKRNVLLMVLREYAGLKQQEGADSVPMDRAALSRIENGAPVKPDQLVRLVEAYGGVRLIDSLIAALQGLRDEFLVFHRYGTIAYA